MPDVQHHNPEAKVPVATRQPLEQVQQQSSAANVQPPPKPSEIPSERVKPAGLNMEEFLPVGYPHVFIQHRTENNVLFFFKSYSS